MVIPLPSIDMWNCILMGIPTFFVINIPILALYLYNSYQYRSYGRKELSIIALSSSIIIFIYYCKNLCIKEIELLKFEPKIKDFNNGFKTITYNINVLPFSEKSNNYLKLVKYLKNFDIILIQESFYSPMSNMDKTNFSNLLNKEGYDVLISPFPEFYDVQWGDSGLVTAVKSSKLRIKEYKFIPFLSKKSVDSVSKKGVLQCTIVDNNGKESIILNTHAQAGYVNHWPNDGLHIETRTDQLKQLRSLVNKENIIIGGDFNFRSEEEIDIIKSKFRFNCINSLDAIFSNYNMTEPEFNNPFDSDHYSVETVIEIK